MTIFVYNVVIFTISTQYYCKSDILPQKKYILGLGPECELKPKPKINSEFNSIHFGIEINKRLKFLTPKNVRV